MSFKHRSEKPSERAEPVGIVVQDGPQQASRPHLAFVWGPEVLPAPSLPFGRWKTSARAA